MPGNMIRSVVTVKKFFTLSRLFAFSEELEREWVLAYMLMTFVYLYGLLPAMGRPLWHDEIFTYYIAHTKSMAQTIQLSANTDLNPPAVYVATHVALNLFGSSPTATRLPSLIEFWIASLCIVLFVRRRLSAGYGLAAVAIFWLTPFLMYAVEARPYAMLLAWFGISMLAWQSVGEMHSRLRALLVLFVAVLGLVLTHVLGAFVLLSLWTAELARWIVRRKPDWLAALAITVPVCITVMYVAKAKAVQAAAFPPAFQASWKKAFIFISTTLYWMSPAMLVCALSGLVIIRLAANGPLLKTGFKSEDLVLVGSLALQPFIINIVLMRNKVAYFDRYAIGGAVAIAVLFIAVLAWIVSRNVAVGAGIWIPLMGFMVYTYILPSLPHAPLDRPPIQTPISKVDPSLPFVAASGLTFIEMDNREDAQFLTRVYYLSDREAAIKYAHATLFEGYEKLKDIFPIRANFARYSDFVRQNRRFLVLGTYEYPEDWLIPKLLADGAHLRYLGDFDTSYKDKSLYEVTFPDNRFGEPTNSQNGAREND